MADFNGAIRAIDVASNIITRFAGNYASPNGPDNGD
eukprot:gene8345-10622_t